MREHDAENRHRDRQPELVQPTTTSRGRDTSDRPSRISACRRGPSTKLCRYEATTRPTESTDLHPEDVWNGERPSLQSWRRARCPSLRRRAARRNRADASAGRARASRGRGLALEDANAGTPTKTSAIEPPTQTAAASRCTATRTPPRGVRLGTGARGSVGRLAPLGRRHADNRAPRSARRRSWCPPQGRSGRRRSADEPGSSRGTTTSLVRASSASVHQRRPVTPSGTRSIVGAAS